MKMVHDEFVLAHQFTWA